MWANRFLVILTLSLIGTAQAKTPSTSSHTCSSAKEFITTLEFLRSNNDFGLDENQAQALAHQVSKGCSGAAQRFVSSVQTLSRVEAGTKLALKVGVKLSHKSPSYSRTFLGIFKRAYLKNYLDLDLTTSLKMAQSLSLDYKGNVEQALKDFLDIAKFCQSDEVGLSGPQCGVLAQEVVKNNENSPLPVFEAFKKVYKFAQSTETLKTPIAEALKLARNVVKTSPMAADNFIFAYKYGVNDKGLKLSAHDSLGFAQTMVNRTIKKSPLTEQKESPRLPASPK